MNHRRITQCIYGSHGVIVNVFNILKGTATERAYKRLLQKQKAIDSDSADLHQPTVYVS